MPKPRKWSNLDGVLPEEPEEVSERELAIRAKCDELRGLALDPETGQPYPKKSMKELAQDYGQLAEEEDFEALAHKQRSVQYEALERVIFNELERVRELSGQDVWRGEGQTFSPSYEPYPVVVDRQALLRWIRETGQEALLDISGPKLKSLVHEALNTDMAAALTPAQRALLKPGQPASGQPPPGVTVFLKKGVNRRSIK